jgi:TRAP-type C4-dicarboxylate transport system substrate-binding protein
VAAGDRRGEPCATPDKEEMMPLIARIAVIAVALFVGACGGGDTQRTGGEPAPEPTVLKLANANSETEELQRFIDKVEELSDGRLRVKPVNDWRQGEEQYEKGLIEDVAAGKADLGWVGSRALATVGVNSFEPLNAPFLLNSYELQDEVLRGEVATRMLADLERLGVTGVSVLPGPLRYLQLDRKIDGDLDGLRIAGIKSVIQHAALEAMGAEPVVIAAGDPIDALNGIESTAYAIHGNGYVDTAAYTVADMPLWPRPYVMFANTDAWNALSEADRKLVLRAAAEARPEMLADTVERERNAFNGMCKAGNHAFELGAGGRARMQQAVEPVLAELRGDPATDDAMTAIESMGAGSPPHSLACPTRSGGRAALEGVFETTLRKSEPGSEALADDWEELGATSQHLTLELSDGRAVITIDAPDGPEIGFDEAYTVYRDRIRFSGSGSPPFSMRWTLDGDELRFSDGSVDDPAEKAAGKFVWERTWTRTR